jgi:hypothetical protein
MDKYRIGLGSTESRLISCGSMTASIEDTNIYSIRVIIWDMDGNLESNIPVTIAYNGLTETLYSAEDGTVCFNTLNIGSIPDRSYIDVSCKYETKQVPVNYEYGITGVTFNEPDEATSIAMWIAMGFAGVVSLGGGIYYLIRKPRKEDED